MKKLLLFTLQLAALVSLQANNFHVVEQGVCYRSDQLNEKELKNTIKSHGIKSILILTEDIPHFEQRLARENRIQLFHVPMKAFQYPTPTIVGQLLEAFRFMKQPMLVHCKHGMDRTGIALALWSIEKKSANKLQAGSHLAYAHTGERKIPMTNFVKLWSDLRAKYPTTALGEYRKLYEANKLNDKKAGRKFVPELGQKEAPAQNDQSVPGPSSSRPTQS